MNKKTFLGRLILKLIGLVELQLFLTATFLPLFAYWGMPSSFFSLMGNIISAPFAICFLGVSAVFFFCELLGVPQGCAAYILELVSWVWLKAGACWSSAWLFYFPQPSIFFCLIVAFCSLAVLHIRYFSSPLRRILIFLCIVLLSIFWMKWNKKQSLSDLVIACGRGQMQIVGSLKGPCIINFSPISTVQNPESWVDYSLIPRLAQVYGENRIYAVIVPVINRRVLRALVLLVESVSIENIYLNYWHAIDNEKGKAAAKLFGLLKQKISKTGTCLHRMKACDFVVKLDAERSLQVTHTPSKKNIESGGLTMNAFCIELVSPVFLEKR